MKPAPTVSDASYRAHGDFSVVLGGPFFQLLRRAHLTGDALQLLRRRIVVLVLVTWFPLLVLSYFSRGRGVAVPFLSDIDVHVRFFVAMPLLLIAEIFVHRRMRFVVDQFLERHLIPEDAVARFESAVASALRLRNSALAEALLIATVYGFGVQFLWRHHVALGTSTWYATITGESRTLTPAGIWYGYVALPIFQFLLCRWYFRLAIWTRFLWQISRIDLMLVPTHPDRVGGLGFLSFAVYAFAPIAAAHGALLAGFLAIRIFYVGATLPEFAVEIVLVVLFVMCVTVGPLLVFAPQLAWSKRMGAREYGVLAERYVRTFDTKWLRGGARADEPLIGSADIQSLADMSNSFEVVRSMRIVPVTRDAALELVVATLAPLAPLLLTMMPIDELIKTLFGILV